MKIITTILVTILFSVLANAQVVPIVEMQSGGLLGGVENGKYLDAKTTFGKLKGAKKYSLFDITGKTGDITETVQAPDEPCDDFYSFNQERDERKGVGIGSSAKWNALPRPLKPIGLTDKTYLKVVSDILRLKGLPKAKAVIEQAVRVDLDGDGVEEVLLTASSYGGKISPQADANNYSFVLLRKVVAGKAQNIMISEEYVKKVVEFGAPNRFEIAGIADLNGDKKMEIVVFGEYYEGNGADVYEIKGNKAVAIEILGAGCGV
ncbi:MAG TPA: hypothetical protein VNB22_11805 [Pyrinomonadaceae bacterium]|nr:hypothetical protein [Pyrinomonadaceae bacterium]